MKPCPYCAELIQDQAAKCRYCGEWLDPSKRPDWAGAPTSPTSAAPEPSAPEPSEPPVDEPEDPTSQTLRVGSGLPEMSELTARRPPEPARSWSAPAWLANAQAAREPAPSDPPLREPPRREPIEAAPPRAASPERSTLKEVALRMERIRQSAAAVREPTAPQGRAVPAGSRDPRAPSETEPGTTMPAGSRRAVGMERSRDGREPATHDPAPHDDYEYEEQMARRLRERPRRPEPVPYSDRPTIPDIPRSDLLAEVERPAPPRRRKAEGRAAPAPRPPADVLEDRDADPFDEHLEASSRPHRGRRHEPEPPPPADFDELDDEHWDDEPPPRGAGPSDYDDAFLGDDDDFDDEGDDLDDFGDMKSAPRPLPWKPILIAAGVIVVAGILMFRDYLFPGDPQTDETAEGDGAEAGEQEGAPAETKPPEPEAKAEGEGQPVEPEAKAEGPADDGAADTPPRPAAMDPATVAQLEEARKAYEAANGNKRKLGPVGDKLQEILAKVPDHPEALTLLAQVYLEQEKLEDSLATSNKCTQVSPESAGCWLTIGVIQETKGAKDIARPAYQKYLDLAPEGRYAKDAQRALQRLK